MADGETMNVKFSVGIMKLEREVWLSRILATIGDRRLAAWEIEWNMCHARLASGQKCISTFTIARYLRQLTEAGIISSETKGRGGNDNRKYYWKNNGGNHDQ